MGRRGQGRGQRTLATAVALLGIVPFAAAQVSDGGKTLRLTLGQSLAYSDNIEVLEDPVESTVRSSTRFGLTYRDVTRTQRLEFTASGVYEIDNGDETELADPFARLTYALEGANNRLRFDAEYRRTDLDDISIPLSLLLPGVIPPEQIVNDVAQIEAGLRTDTSYELEIETGLRSPIGLRLELFSRDRRYNEEQIFDLADNVSQRAELDATFRIDPALTARIEGTFSSFDGEDTAQTDRRETSIGAGLAYDISSAVTADLFIGQRRITSTRDGLLRQADGAEVIASLSRDLPNGDVEVSFSSRQTLDRRNNVLRLDRDQTLRRDGRLSYGIGVSRAEGLDVESLFDLSYVQPLRRGRLNIQLSQEARDRESSDEPVILSQFSASYALALTPKMNFSVRAGVDDVVARVDNNQDRRSYSLRTDLFRQLDSVSSWSLGATLVDTRVSEAGVDTREKRYGVQMSYRRALTRDWDMVAQYQFSEIMETDESDRRSNTISFGLERTFSTRF